MTKRKKPAKKDSSGRSPEFWGWEDPDPKKSDAEKIRDGIHVYVQKFGKPPKYCLTRNPSEPVDGVQVLAKNYVGPDIFYLGGKPW